MRSRSAAIVLACAALFGSACRQDMHNQPRFEPLESSAFFPDGLAARQPVEGTVARGQLHTDQLFYTGRDANGFVAMPPIEITAGTLARGRERFNIYCSPCHGGLGDGEGMVVQRGFRNPPSFHLPRLREAPAGHYFDAITNGFGAMASYASRVSVEDRWAIITYIRALQLSQWARVGELPASDRQQLEGIE